MVALWALVGCGPNVMMPVDQAGCEWSIDVDTDADGVWNGGTEGSFLDGLWEQLTTVGDYTDRSERREDPETGCLTWRFDEETYADGRSEGSQGDFVCDEHGNQVSGRWEEWSLDGQVRVFEMEAEPTVEDGLTTHRREVFTNRATGEAFVYTTNREFDADGNVVFFERHLGEGDDRILIRRERSEWAFVNKQLGFVQTAREHEDSAGSLEVSTSSHDEHGRVVHHRTETDGVVTEFEHEWLPDHWWRTAVVERLDGEEIRRIEMTYPVLEDDEIQQLYDVDGQFGAPLDGVVDYREDFVLTCE